MKSILKLALAIGILFSCQSGSKKNNNESSTFRLRDFQEETLANGLEIIWIRDQSLPRMSLQMMVKVGARDEVASQAGITSMVSGLLDQGTKRRSAPELAEDLAQIGAEFQDSAGHDQTLLTASGLSEKNKELLNLFTEIVLQPAFSNQEIERRRSMTLASIQKLKEQPSHVADEKLDQQIFRDHPYSRPSAGTTDSIKALKSSDLISHYKKYFIPNNSILAVVGMFDEDFKSSVRKSFLSWQGQDLKSTPVRTIQIPEREVLFVQKTGLQQTQIRWGHLGIQRTSPDFLALRLANVILGGAFASRLNQKIRDDMGLTYSISSNSDARLEPGSFEISTFTRHDKAVITILETEKLFRDFVKNGVTDEEVAAAKALLIGQFPAALETVDRMATNLLLLKRQGISDSYLKNFERNVNAIKREQISAVIQKHLNPDLMQLVIYSDEAALPAAELKQLGEMKRVKIN